MPCSNVPKALSFSTTDSDDSPEIESPCSLQSGSDTSVVKSVFLVRHGEALHNVAEKRAMQQALDENDVKDEELKKEVLEIARKSVLTDENLKDAPLSEKGQEQAATTAANIEKIVLEDTDLKAPEAVFVSPLQRALQTAALMFPRHNRVHVRDLLRERCTGFPCDERSQVPSLQSRKSFCHMRFDQVDDVADLDFEPPLFRRFNTWPLIEEKSTLRQRTTGLGRLLQGTSADSVCIVTHKGFLRELERGPLGRPDASEFSNCEVRVYDVSVCEGEIFRAALRRAL